AKNEDGHTPLHWAAGNGHTEVAKLLIDKGADLNAKDKGGIMPLHWAAAYGRTEVAKLLIDKGRDVNAKSVNNETPLHWAAAYGRTEVAKLLIDKGADLNAKDVNNETPLHWAAGNGHTEVAKLLIDKGADINAKSMVNETPLDTAKKAEKTEIISLLVKFTHSFAKNDNDSLLSLARGLWLPGFPADKGYSPIGRTFEKYFTDTTWNVTDKQHNHMSLVFTGVFNSNGKKALFELELKVSDISKPTMLPVRAKVNRKPLSENELNDILFAAFLEAKK
ncbi:MAG: ankyrin repeat domain-containing protein, partial [Desulfovibrionaceae bacterium]|nr:ankyrin repeat domain-containing protein [Desulfovibrionaceae bacterium]